jgi:hypothetical protein
MRRYAEIVKEERIDILRLFQDFGGAAGSVSGIRVYADENRADENRIRAVRPGLQSGGVFEGVAGHDAVVMIGSGDQRGGIFYAGADVM